MAITKLSRKVFYSATGVSSFKHDEGKSEIPQFGCGDPFDLATMKLKFRLGHCKTTVESLEFGRGDVSDLAMMKKSRKVFDSVTAVSAIWPDEGELDRCRFSRDDLSIRP